MLRKYNLSVSPFARIFRREQNTHTTIHRLDSSKSIHQPPPSWLSGCCLLPAAALSPYLFPFQSWPLHFEGKYFLSADVPGDQRRVIRREPKPSGRSTFQQSSAPPS